MRRSDDPSSVMISLTLPWPPSANTYIRHARGRHFPTAKARAFRQIVAEIVAEKGAKPLIGRLSLTIRLFPPDKRKRDIDNVIKPLQDALMHAGCFADDEAIDALHVTRGPVLKGGSAKVLILRAS